MGLNAKKLKKGVAARQPVRRECRPFSALREEIPWCLARNMAPPFAAWFSAVQTTCTVVLMLRGWMRERVDA
eukprot:6202015-Pleurochrysis_carterae.AAC.3